MSDTTKNPNETTSEEMAAALSRFQSAIASGAAATLEFLHMLCGGDKAQHTRLLDWLTHAVRHPNAPGDTALCVSGPQGCGKSLLWNITRHLLQSHGHCIDMGAHEHWLLPHDTACVRFGECTQHEFMHLAPRLRAAIDNNHVVSVRNMYQPPTTIQVRARFVVTTNEALDVAENDLKRFTFIQCSNARVGNQAYFQTLHAAIHDAGTISAVCKFLRHRPLWALVRSFVRARAVVVYWLGLTEHLMAPGGAAEARDRMDYEMDHKGGFDGER